MKAVEATLENIALAAKILQQGGLVAMPTETVYGIAVDAFNEDAIRRLYELKARPGDNPLIVHVSEITQLEGVTTAELSVVRSLADRFWPGPLTLVLPKHPCVPSVLTGGLDTVAVRQPRHPVALSLIALVGRPVAAPSANAFMRLSPTCVEHLDPVIAEKLDMVLDGGPCQVGLESTVLDLTQEPPRVLRPGNVSRGDIQAALGRPLAALPGKGPKRSPGMYRRHYAPITPLRLVERVPDGEPGLVLGELTDARQIAMPSDPTAYAAHLYAALHRLDQLGVPVIWVERPPRTVAWEAVIDRLAKASATDAH